MRQGYFLTIFLLSSLFNTQVEYYHKILFFFIFYFLWSLKYGARNMS